MATNRKPKRVTFSFDSDTPPDPGAPKYYTTLPELSWIRCLVLSWKRGQVQPTEVKPLAVPDDWHNYCGVDWGQKMALTTPADLTTTEAAAVLAVQPATVKQYIRRGLLSATKRGRDWFIPAAEVERFARERRKPGKPKSPANQPQD
jgi:excisionase family DNA binding protein